ncbi:Heterokaryon incompatibility protein (HET) domain containing protein [Hyaloscypha variabilis]
MDANQARRRTDLDSISTPETGSISQTSRAFVYQPLDPDEEADSVRLLHIELSTGHDDPLSCSLIHVKFAQKPKYRALSYMWGDEAVEAEILLNGVRFRVRQNLWDALHYLRNSEAQRPFWIDAICINQCDVEERNRQLAMMKWIYFRAETVVVWLGKKYSAYQLPNKLRDAKDIVIQESSDRATALDTTSERESSDEKTVKITGEELAMVTELCSDGYWDRLWIIQEIGQAAQIEVCFGILAMDWNAFIEMVTLHNSSCEGPLRLNRLLQEKYSGSHTLRKLLQDHRKALCKEPRDKIYGLVGLAADAIGFPMDYNKSLIEIWKDTMIFMNGRGLLPDTDIIPFGRLVKSLLIGDTPTIEDINSPRVFKVSGFIVGCILAIGPSTDQIISSLHKADDWAGETQRNFKSDLGEAHREKDILMRAIQDFDKSQLESMCFSHVSSVRWSINLGDCSLPATAGLCNYQYHIGQAQSRDEVSIEAKAQAASQIVQVSATSTSHLFLVKNSWRGQTPWKMGVASSLAKPGDLVCWIQGVNRALILRVNMVKEIAILRVFGTALFTEDFKPNSKSPHSSRLSWFNIGEMLDIQMDAATIYVLLA